MLFSFFFFLNQRPSTPRERRAWCQTPLPSLLCSSALRVGFVLGEQPRPQGCCSPRGSSAPSSTARLSPGVWALLAHSTLSLAALSNQHTPVLETGLTAQPLLLPCVFFTGLCHLNTFFCCFLIGISVPFSLLPLCSEPRKVRP